MPKTIFTDANLIVIGALKDERLRAGIKQAELAKKIGKDQSWVSLVEGSQRRVDVVEFIQIAKALGADPIDLLRQIIDQME
ncbi:MAG: helix-turn-helix domain-containing protein [Pseudomonas fluorescens]|uniref:helix-turn-helix domain-containing protein n=1 Tax=Sphingopyxis sp. TaxID=1908224 RepID=UPI003D6D070D